MLELCLLTDENDSSECLVQKLLTELASVEAGARAGLRLIADQGVHHFVSHSSEELDQPVPWADEIRETDRMFPELGHEHIAQLPNAQGTIHLAAPTTTEQHAQAYQLQLPRVGAILLLALDASAAKRKVSTLRHELWQLQKLATIGQSAASVVHELNNPLTTIMAYSDFLMRRCEEGSGDDAMLDRLARIHEAAIRIQHFSRQLIDYSRPSSVLPGPVAIHAVIDRALGFCMHLLGSSDIVVERSYCDLPVIDGLETPLTQVFVNLITNAWHAMRDDAGTLRLATRREDDTIIIQVSDEGRGIAPENLGRLFDAYFTTKSKTTGIGLGLHIVHQIIVDHGGRITATNREPRGALFTIELPLGG
jgi:C4-dicarboxylate-specific signal transduction histidine kinase